MLLRTLVLLLSLGAVGCGGSSPTPDADSKAQVLPPEVDLDPAAAAVKHKAAQKKPRP